jgi:two-component system alkaline phosphatase synthesis response regulator PhoP/two-component system response regulator VicR
MSARILVVDDDPTIVRLLRVNLEMEGYEVVSASNGREALEAVARHAPDLVLCDVMMPVMDGLEVVSRLKRDESTANLPVVLLSAKAQDADIRHGKGAGADEYMTKPFDPLELLSAVERILAGQPAKPKAKRRSRAKTKRTRT